MRYEVRLLDDAERCLSAIPPALHDFVEKQLLKLGSSPSTMSRPVVSPPYPPGGMMYEFDFVLGSEFHHFVVLFHYGQDESTLLVSFIGHTDLEIGS
jgi:hypothetical protein